MVQCKVDFSEGTLAKDFANSVKVNSGLRHLAILTETQANVLADFLEYLFFSRELGVMLN